MAQNILYLFPDTNLFVQCRQLGELDWVNISPFSEIHLIVSRPVQGEIDNQKSRGNGRIQKRARKASSLFREILLSNSSHKIISNDDPVVKLFLWPENVKADSCPETLNLSEPDDHLVAAVWLYRKRHPGDDVRLLTHDTGPMGTAKTLDVPFVPIPDTWILPPETSEKEKKIKELEQQVAMLKSSEPTVTVECLNYRYEAVDILECEYVKYQALSKDEIEKLLALLEDRFPMAVPKDDSGAVKVEKDKNTNRYKLNISSGYIPLSENAVQEYEKNTYPDWLNKCKDIFNGLHQELQKMAEDTTFCYSINNKGTRPGRDVLVEFEAFGDFMIMPPRDEDSGENEPIELSEPPKPPAVQYHKKSSLSLVDAIANMGINRISSAGNHAFSRNFDFPIAREFKRDPNAFYYKTGKSGSLRKVEKSFSLECEQWRHGNEPELFNGIVVFDNIKEKIEGMLECRVHAENLTEVVVKRITIRINVKTESIYDKALALIDSLQ
ncbi:hypothetical protein MNBD_NITROSPINAE04-108 [hydrothermal vent metagenome]|uniref:PIN domain-containing protein n=1 Tax=hydrothermal vent metagenome TaxID=652676 RepID=A0A3B1BF94_9ZZZZ